MVALPQSPWQMLRADPIKYGERSCGCALVNRICNCSLVDRRPTVCDLNGPPLYDFILHLQPLYAFAMKGRCQAPLLTLNRFCQTSVLAYLTRGAKPASAAACMQAKSRRRLRT